MKTETFFDPETWTLTHVVFDPAERVGVVIDPVLDFDPVTGRTRTDAAEQVARFLDRERLAVPFVLDTHAHADHVTAMPFFKSRFGARSAIGKEIVHVQRTFAALFDLGDDFACDGSQFDRLLSHGERLDVGPFEIEAWHTPGHTPACMSYRVGDLLFVGDVLFQPDYGTARCDFPGGSAVDLYRSIRTLYAELPAETRVLTGHDYRPGGRPVAFESTLEAQRSSNVQLPASVDEADFVRFREERDASLSLPRLMLPSVQLNIRAGEFPEPAGNGLAYLKIPLNAPIGGRSGGRPR
jgi:glyoxylase-like metal-dependent hydrolase (beta-lactamase superfamily II)